MGIFKDFENFLFAILLLVTSMWFRGKKPSLSLFQTFKKPINKCDLIDESAFLKQCKLSVEKAFKMKI